MSVFKKQQRARRGSCSPALVLFAAALLFIAIAAAGCGCGAGGKDEAARAHPLSTFRGVSEFFSRADGCIPLDDRLITFAPESLPGRLPPAEPVELVTRGNQDLMRVAITIDDGWNADMRILDLFESRGLRFTAFVIGGRGIAEDNPGFLRRIQDSGGEVCNHTYSHHVMRDRDREWVLDEIWRSQDIITRVTGEVYPYVRFSGGAYDMNSLEWTAEQGFWVVNWSISTGDTAPGITVDRQVASVLDNLHPGGIILCHFGGHNTYEVLSIVIPEIQRRGYEIVSLSELFEGTPFRFRRSEFRGEGAEDASGRGLPPGAHAFSFPSCLSASPPLPGSAP